MLLSRLHGISNQYTGSKSYTHVVRLVAWVKQPVNWCKQQNKVLKIYLKNCFKHIQHQFLLNYQNQRHHEVISPYY